MANRPAIEKVGLWLDRDLAAKVKTLADPVNTDAAFILYPLVIKAKPRET